VIEFVTGEFKCRNHNLVDTGIKVSGSGAYKLDGVYCAWCWIESIMGNGMGVKKLTEVVTVKKEEEVKSL